jgi:hypothetical protein
MFVNLKELDYLQIFSGIYIIVRGLDNIDTGIKGKPFEPIWNRMILKRYKPG